MATTQNTFTGNGSNLGPFSFTFKWLESTDIKVSVGGVLKTAGTHYNLQSLNYTTKTGGQVLFTAGNAPANGASIRIYRDTDDEALSAVFSSGSAIRAKDLNDNFTQNLYVTQETNNHTLNVDGSIPMRGNLNMDGYQIDNLATPTASGDAATKDYVDAFTGNTGIPGHTRWRKLASAGQTVFSGTGDYGGTLSYSPVREQVYLNGALQQRNADYSADNGTSVTFNVALQLNDVVDIVCTNNLVSGTVSNAANISYNGQFTGQTTRTVAAKLADVVSVKDFGAVGDGVTDDTAAIQATLASGARQIHLPAGTYVVRNTLVLQQDQALIGDGRGEIFETNNGTTLFWDQAPPVAAQTQWTDIGNGLDDLSFAPCIVLGGSSCVVKNLDIQTDNYTTDWSAGIFIPATQGHYISNIKVDGVYTGAGLYIDSTWSDRNTTLKTLHPAIAPTGGPLEIVATNCYLRGKWGAKIQGTDRDGAGYTVANWPFGWEGTSDIVFTNCQFRPTSSTLTAGNSAGGGGVYHSSKVMFTDGVVAQARGPKFIGCTFRVSASFIAKFDWSKEVVFTAPMGETINVYRSTYGNAWFEISSNTDIVSVVDNSIQFCRFAQNGVAEANTGTYYNSSTKPKLVLSDVDQGAFYSPYYDVTWGTNNRDTVIKGFGSADAIVFQRGSNDVDLGKWLHNGTNPILELNSEGVVRSKSGSSNNAALYFHSGITPVFWITSPGNAPQLVSYGPVRPDADNVSNLGFASKRWGTVYAGTGTINTSDQRTKQDIDSLSDAELRVATALKGIVKRFRFKDAVQAKNDNARIHVGVVAQEVIAAFQAEGLDPMRYGIVCYDQWDAELDDEGNEIVPSGDRYGIRYGELFAFIIAAL